MGALHRWAWSGGGPVEPGSRLLRDLTWWFEWLAHERLSQLVPAALDLPVAILYTDAEGGGGIGAVLVKGSDITYFSGRVSRKVSAALRSRATQIFPFEVIAVAAAVSQWKRQLQGHRVVIFVDNRGALGALRKGASTQDDVGRILLMAWSNFIAAGILPIFLWVPSALNCADPPSRGAAPPVGQSTAFRFDWTPILQALCI